MIFKLLSKGRGTLPAAAHSACALFIAVTLSGCGHKQAQYEPPPPPLEQQPAKSHAKTTPQTSAPTTTAPEAASEEDRAFVRNHTPIYTEEGLATWYTAARGRHSANGDLFDDNKMTAAHRTLPMGSLVVVTNLKTGQSAILRITDRGPFVSGRILDLSKAAAKATGVYREGLSNVRLDVYQVPKPIHSGGKWCVQIGAFKSEEAADKLKAQLQKKYPDAKVIDFPGEASYWVRIRPAEGNREQAESIAKHLKPAEGEAFLTRLD
jgi:rare lipoprotein A